MSRFYASIQGGKGIATRCGHSSINGHIRGWSVGVNVRGMVDDQGEDTFEVWGTHGSSNKGHAVYVGDIRLVDGMPRFFPNKPEERLSR